MTSTAAPALPRLAQSDEADTLTRRLVLSAFGALMEHLPRGSFEAVILTGAMTRGEGSVLRRLDGSLALLSDIDFLIITASPRWHRALRRPLLHLSREMNRQLRPRGLTSHVDYLAATAAQTRAWQSRIFTNEILASGVVLAGQGPVARFFSPAVRPETIVREDALAMIHTRMMGQLAMLDEFDSPDTSRREFALYHCGKTVTDLAAIALAAHGRFACSCQARLHAMREFLQTGEGHTLARAIPDLLAHLERWTAFKRDADLRRLCEELGTDPTPARQRAVWDELWEWLRRALRALWRHEIQQVRGIGADLPLDDAIDRAFPPAGLAAAARGWAKAHLHPASRRDRLSLRRTARALAARRAPLAMCFAAAATLFFADTLPPAPETLLRAERRSPVPARHPGDWRALNRDLLWLWRLLVKGGAE